MIMLDVKKSYAYRQISVEAKIDPETNQLVAGNIFDVPQIEKKSGMGVKSDTIELTKTILDFLIQVAFDDNIPRTQKYSFAAKELQKFHNEFLESLKTLNVTKIGVPIRWQKKINAINAMKFYNALVEKSFQYLGIGHLLYIRFHSSKLIDSLKMDIPTSKINAIAIPPKVNPEQVREAFQKYQIEFNITTQWDLILNKTCQRLYETLKDAAKNG